MEENFYVFFKNYHKNKEIPESEQLKNKKEHFDSNYKRYKNEITNKKHNLDEIKSDTIQKM